MTVTKFEVIAIRGVRRWKENGKARQETKNFFQTINPYNKDENGIPKTRAQIMQELITERAAWMKKGKL